MGCCCTSSTESVGSEVDRSGKTPVLPGAFEWLPLCTGAEPGVFTGGMAPVA